MQRQFTIELRVDYDDEGKNEAMRVALQAAARHIFATASLLKDSVQPQVSIFSDDFFSGHEIIELLEDTLAKGGEQIGGMVDEGVSSELLAAVKDDIGNGEAT